MQLQKTKAILLSLISAVISTLSITTIGMSFMPSSIAQTSGNVNVQESIPGIGVDSLSTEKKKKSKEDNPSRILTDTVLTYVRPLKGKIASTDGNAAETACNSISVTLTDLIPGETSSNFGSGFNRNKIAQVKATGSTLNNGCTYSLDHGANSANRDDRARFELSATAPIKISSCSFSETKRFKEIPSTLDLAMVQSCLR